MMYALTMDKETDELTVKIATELRVARERMTGTRLTNQEISKRVGVSAMAVGRYMDGSRAIPVPTFMLICEALGVNAGSILDASLMHP